MECQWQCMEELTLESFQTDKQQSSRYQDRARAKLRWHNEARTKSRHRTRLRAKSTCHYKEA